MTPDPPDPADRRTEVNPSPSVPPRERERERVTTGPAVADAASVHALADTVRSLRTALVVLAVLTVGALALGAVALSKTGDDGTVSGGGPDAASNDRVSRVVKQVKDLRSDSGKLQDAVDGAAKDSDLQSLRDTVSKLDDRVSKLDSSSGGGDQKAAVDALDGRIGKLEQQVQALEQSSAASP